ncbi:molybdopterin cofactor-binding domain-containing protein [Sphingomonas sp.]|uniref:molybdopterin cofactor-binding domain-containing protein n=1 Tax=Sphingomonas sp. TaxID=28214 RepID=UPI00286E979A|nr:molybdopterin cofactor-binding domain-containing protein [Sphingomonas sp.]
MPAVDRRTLLIGGGAGIGLIVAFALWPRAQVSPLRAGADEQAFDHFLKIGRDGRVTVAVPQAETGQGAWTALPQILADELGAAWETVAVEPAPLSPRYANALAADQGWRGKTALLRITAGSTSVRAFERPLREAGAAARGQLIAAAAERWNIDEGECDTADGFVVAGARRLGFGELAEEAAGLEPRAIRLRAPGSGRLAGRPLERLDLPAKSDGSLRFAGDVRLPSMLFAAARLAPLGGRLTGFSRAGAEGVPGVRAVIADARWLAVAADTGWAAERALKIANARFTGPAGDPWDALLDAALDGDGGEAWFERGDYGSAVDGKPPLEATYRAAPAAHLALEAAGAAARWTGDRLEVWAATLAPDLLRASAERASGAAHVTIYPMPVGDSGGGALEANAVPVAIAVAKKLGRPVQLTLSTTTNHNHDRLGPPAAGQMSAMPGEGGGVAAWKMRVAGANGLAAAFARLSGTDDKSELRGAVPPYAIPNVAIDTVAADLPFATGYLRGDPERFLTFASESFVDELARAANADPFGFRMAMLSGQPRLARCLQSAAAAGGWDGGGPGSTLGLAAASAYGSHIALLADAGLGPSQQIEVRRLVATVDCGRVINPSLVRQQIEGGLIWALGLALAPAPTIAGGIARARPQALPRLAGMPQFHVRLVTSSAAPGGVSGLAVPVLAPALANAIAAATGKRMRELPLDPMSA